jgi:hypothetical protein
MQVQSKRRSIPLKEISDPHDPGRTDRHARYETAAVVVYDPPHQGWAAVHHSDEANRTTLIKASL